MPSVHLTFDDGPDPRCTPALLDLLREHGAGATFFPIAGRAAAHPGLIERMLADGHTVGVHCDEHVRHSERSADEIRADTASAVRTLRMLGAEPTLWRTPWGDLAPFTAQLAAEFGMRIVGWTLDTHDWRGDSAAEMLARIEPGLADAAIVLAHDGIGPGAERDSAVATVELVRRLAPGAAARNFELQPL